MTTLGLASPFTLEMRGWPPVAVDMISNTLARARSLLPPPLAKFTKLTSVGLRESVKVDRGRGPRFVHFRPGMRGTTRQARWEGPANVHLKDHGEAPAHSGRDSPTCVPVSTFGVRRWALLRDEESRHPAGSFFGKSGQAVGVAVQGDADIGMAQAFGDDLGMHSRPEGQGGVGVPKVMEADAG